MPAPAFGAAGTTLTATNSAAANVAVPASVAADHVILVHLYKENTAAVTPPSGFTELTTAPATTGNVQTFHTFWKRATGADSGTYNFTWTGSVLRQAVAVRYTGCITTGTPLEGFTGAGRSSNGTVTPGVSLTTTGPDRLIVWGGTSWEVDAGGSWTPPSGYTERVDSPAIGVATLTQAAAGSTGSITGTYSPGSNYQTATLLALLPVPTARPSDFMQFFF